MEKKEKLNLKKLFNLDCVELSYTLKFEILERFALKDEKTDNQLEHLPSPMKAKKPIIRGCKQETTIIKKSREII